APNQQSDPTIVSDDAGGAIIAWDDFRPGPSTDIYAQHVLASGSVDPVWPANGRGVCTAASYQSVPTLARDGTGGAIITWMDYRSLANDHIYAQHVAASGVVDAAWPVDGRAVCTASNEQSSPVIVADDNGGVVITWYDNRNYAASDIYAQRIGRYGYLGTPEAEISSITDAPNDQGGKVKVSWRASYLENDPWFLISYYNVFRSVPPN